MGNITTHEEQRLLSLQLQSVEARRAPQYCEVQSMADGQPHKLLGSGFESQLRYQFKGVLRLAV